MSLFFNSGNSQVQFSFGFPEGKTQMAIQWEKKQLMT